MDRSDPSANPPYGHAHPTTESAASSPAAENLAHLLTHEDVDRARDRWQAGQPEQPRAGALKVAGAVDLVRFVPE